MSHTVTIEPIGEQIEVEEGQTILAAALRQGVWLPFACGHGTCATCKVQVLEGDVEIGDASPFALMDVERDEGKVVELSFRGTVTEGDAGGANLTNWSRINLCVKHLQWGFGNPITQILHSFHIHSNPLYTNCTSILHQCYINFT